MIKVKKECLYHVTQNKTELCLGLECICEHHGDCDNCKLINDYNNSCKEE